MSPGAIVAALRLALRRMRRHPLHAGVSIACLALGIGANSAIFSVVNALLLRPLPVERDERLAFTLGLRGDDDPYEASLLDYIALRTQATAFSGVGAATPRSFNLSEGERPERVSAAAVTADYLSTLGVRPVLGRGFTEQDDRPGGEGAALIGYGLWQRRFGGEPGVVGRALRLAGRSHTVVGVLPAGFDLPLATEVWVPLGLVPDTLPADEQDARDYLMVARLRDGATWAQAQTEARTLARRLEQSYPERRAGWGLKLIPLRQQLIGDINGHIRPALLLLLAVVGFLLLLTCANVASLQLVRALERGHEIAVQVALGAERRRIVSSLLGESLLLSLLGGGLGLLLAALATPPLMALSPVQANALAGQLSDARLDLRVLAFTCGVSVAAGLLFGLAPALGTSLEQQLLTRLREGGRRASGTRASKRLFGLLTLGEIALAMTLLVGAGLVVHSFRHLASARLGFRADERLVVELHLAPDEYPDRALRVAFAEALLERVRALPGVASAGVTTTIPLAVSSWDAAYAVEGQALDPGEVPLTAHRLVSPGYLETLGVRPLAGRLIEARDREGGQLVAVVTRSFAERAWPGRDALGQRVGPRRQPPGGAWFTVVGVLDDVKEDRFNFRIDRPVWYLPLAQREGEFPLNLVVHASGGDALALAPAVRAALHEIDRNQPISRVTTLARHVDQFLGPQRFSALLSGLFAVLGLVLAAVGVYGVTAYGMAQRTTEFGIRMALGAPPGGLVRLVLGEGARVALLGLGLGALGGVLVGRALHGTLYQVRPADPFNLAAVGAVLMGVMALATWLPARRVARLDPNLALRHE
jgi:predicted permease